MNKMYVQGIKLRRLYVNKIISLIKTIIKNLKYE